MRHVCVCVCVCVCTFPWYVLETLIFEGLNHTQKQQILSKILQTSTDRKVLTSAEYFVKGCLSYAINDMICSLTAKMLK